MKNKKRIYLLLIALSLGLPIPTFAATLGITSENATSMSVESDYTYASVFTATSNFSASSISVRVMTPNAMGLWYGKLYDVDGTNFPTTELGRGSTEAVHSNAWTSSTLSTAVPITAGKTYCIAVIFQYNQTVATDNSSGLTYEKNVHAPNPFGTTTTATALSIVCYASDVAPTATPTVTATSTATTTHTQTATPTYTITKTATPSASPTLTYTITKTTTPSASPTMTSTFTITPTCTITPSITTTTTRTLTVTQSTTYTITPYVIEKEKVMTYPAPAMGQTAWFYYYAPAQSVVTIDIFNMVGEKGKQITVSHHNSGYQRTPWEIASVAPGIYLYRVTISSPEETTHSAIQKMVIIKK